MTIVAPDASPEEAAAIVAALEQFMRATAPRPHAQAPAPAPSRWLLAALHEGVERGSTVPSDKWAYSSRL